MARYAGAKAPSATCERSLPNNRPRASAKRSRASTAPPRRKYPDANGEAARHEQRGTLLNAAEQ